MPHGTHSFGAGQPFMSERTVQNSSHSPWQVAAKQYTSWRHMFLPIAAAAGEFTQSALTVHVPPITPEYASAFAGTAPPSSSPPASADTGACGVGASNAGALAGDLPHPASPSRHSRKTPQTLLCVAMKVGSRASDISTMVVGPRRSSNPARAAPKLPDRALAPPPGRMLGLRAKEEP